MSLLVAAWSSTVIAAPPARMPTVATSGDYLARMDTDRDGRVSLPEFQAWMGYAFERMDADRDGVVETHELPGGRGQPIALEEHRHLLAERFARQDRNGDGVLDARELAAPPR
ncbi:MAG: EF-hand domain-containing protein [Pseudomonadota bacterium]